MPSAPGDPRTIRSLDTIHEDEIGVEHPITHVLFSIDDENLALAPFSTASQSDASDETIVGAKLQDLHLQNEDRATWTGAEEELYK